MTDVRRADARDLDTLVALRAAMFEAMGTSGPAARAGTWRAEARAWFADRLEDERVRLVVVEADGRVLATATGTLRDSAPSPTNPAGGDVLVSNVSTAPEARRRGYAGLAVAEVVRWARTTGAGRAELIATGSGRSIYEAEGFAVADEPMMRLSLSGELSRHAPRA